MRRRNAIGSQAVVVLPSTLTAPAEGSNKRLTSFKVVVFPHPDSPSKTKVSPRSTVKLRSVIMFVPESEKLTLSNSTSALWAGSVIKSYVLSLTDSLCNLCVLIWISLCNLCVLCASVVVVTHPPITTETQRTQRLHREDTKLGHHS